MEKSAYRVPTAKNWVTLVIVALVVGIGLGVVAVFLDMTRYRTTMSWVASDGTVLVSRDTAKAGLRPSWKTIHSVLPWQARGQTVEIILADLVQGTKDGRLVHQTENGWVMYIQLGDIPKGKRQAFSNASVIYSATLMAGRPREEAIKRVMTMASTPASFE